MLSLQHHPCAEADPKGLQCDSGTFPYPFRGVSAFVVGFSRFRLEEVAVGDSLEYS